MTRSAALAHRLDEVFLNGKWIANTNYKEQISDLSWEEATKRISGLNSIAMLTFHINYYLDGLLHFFNKGELTIKDKYSFNMPEIKSQQDWEVLKTQFLKNAQAFAVYIKHMDDSQLDAVFIDKKYGTYLRNVEGMIEHSYYHFGQISLIKKLVLQGSV